MIKFSCTGLFLDAKASNPDFTPCRGVNAKTSLMCICAEHLQSDATLPVLDFEATGSCRE